MEGNVYGLSSSLNIQWDIEYRKIVLSEEIDKLGSISASEAKATKLKESSITCLSTKRNKHSIFYDTKGQFSSGSKNLYNLNLVVEHNIYNLILKFIH